MKKLYKGLLGAMAVGIGAFAYKALSVKRKGQQKRPEKKRGKREYL